MDINIVSGDGILDIASSGFIAGQNLNNTTISLELAQLNNPTAVLVPLELPGSQMGGT